MKKIKAAIIGASGYTGAELVRLLYAHGKVEITCLVADSNAGKPISEIYPHFSRLDLPDMVKLDDADLNVDVAFCCLPHGTSQEVIAALPESLRIIDLSADFRIKDAGVYQKWYGEKHTEDKLREEAVYGLTEMNRGDIKSARLIANPGCYPTSVLLPMLPLIESGRIPPDGRVIVDSKSGITGAGRTAKTANLFSEVDENVRPYGIGGHRHVAEMEQEMSKTAMQKMMITFTPQVVPMNRGILSCIYVEEFKGVDATGLKEVLVEHYKGEVFIDIPKDNRVPTTREVAGTNNAMINVFADRIEGKAIIISAIDNLVKGASGQAVQNMNVMFDLDETEGLKAIATFP